MRKQGQGINMERGYRIDYKIFFEAIKQREPLWKAALLAGSKAKNKQNLTRTGFNILERKPEMKQDVIQAIEERQRWILNAMTETKIEGAPLKELTVALGVTTDKLRLLRGQSTQNQAIIVKWKDDKEPETISQSTQLIEKIIQNEA